MPEVLGSGCGFVDYDNDGDQDILLINSAFWPQPGRRESSHSVITLFANDGTGRFRDVTPGSGLDVSFRAMGIAAADYDNDGLCDLFFTAMGENRLFRNEGAGRFRDVTSSVGVEGRTRQCTTGASWFDYDNDGFLDLLVCGYAEKRDAAEGPPARGGPSLYRNERNGRFREVSGTCGIKVDVPTRSVAIAPVDLNDDGWMDVIVANQAERNLVFRNKRDGTFAEIGVACGMAYDGLGNMRPSRGIDAAWYSDDRSLGVAIAGGEGLSLFVGRGGALRFTDESPREGIAALTRPYSSFGAVFLDYDLDGWPDLLMANGGPERMEPAQLLWNGGPRAEIIFQSVSAKQSGDDFFKPLAGRGVAYGDIDGDNDLDVLISQHHGPPVLFRNDQATDHRSLRLKLIGSRCARDALGARVTIHGAERVWRSAVMGTRGYLSQSELPLTFGYGPRDKPRAAEIRWPGGYVQKLRLRPGERNLTVVEPGRARLANNDSGPSD